jgi:hypothetical protein
VYVDNQGKANTSSGNVPQLIASSGPNVLISGGV